MRNLFESWFRLASLSTQSWRKNMQMLEDTSFVVQQRLAMIDGMRNNPVEMMNLSNWFEVQTMFWEKMFAFQLALMNVMATQPVNTRNIMTNSHRAILAQQRYLGPIQETVRLNAKRLRDRTH